MANGKAAKTKVAELDVQQESGAMERLTISAPDFRTVTFNLRGTAPYMQCAFPFKARQAMREKMMAGQTARKGKVRTARDFDDDFIQAQHKSTEGWNGIVASSFRNAAIDVCRMVGYKMTHAKMSIFIEADGLDALDGQPLVKILGPKPEKTEMPVRNATGVADIRVRPMWRDWGVSLRVRYDADQFTAQDVANLMERAGQQVGVGEGRPYSKDSNGLGYGLFTVRAK